MNKFMNGLVDANNYTLTENGGLTRKTTKSDLLDMFAFGAAMRTRPDEDIILMWRKAYAENPEYALKCLFYIRDILDGQGERRFFRVVLKDLAQEYPTIAIRNLQYIPMLGRWDDLYAFVGTPVESAAFLFIKKQLAIDLESKTPSLLAKWLKSENTSSAQSRSLANKTRIALRLTHKQYRKILSNLRERINVLEKLMSAKQWDKIEFDKIPSKAGMIYKNAFARHDIERVKANETLQTYADFAKDKTKTVNAKTLYPYECVAQAIKESYTYYSVPLDDTERAIVNKYWDNLTDYFNGAVFNGLAVVDTSASMRGSSASAPINVAISLGMYCAEKAKGPFAGHYVSFSAIPKLIKVEGIDFVDKVKRIYETNLCENTNIEATFDMLLNTAIQSKCTQEELPQNIIIISDMEFDEATARTEDFWRRTPINADTVMEQAAKKWEAAGYKLPHLIFWNVNARHNNIPMLGNGPISYVSGMSPSIFQTIMSGKTGYELMIETLNSDKYKNIK